MKMRAFFLSLCTGILAALFVLAGPARAHPCGRIIFFSSSSEQGELASVRGDGAGRESIRQVPFPDTYLISPDASFIAVSLFSQRSETTDIWLMNSEGTDYRNITKTPRRSEIVYDWGPGGRRIAIERSGPSGTAIYLLNAHTGKQRRIVDGFSPSFSPSGKKLAFSAPSPDISSLSVTSDIFTIRLADGHTRRLTEDRTSDDDDPDWSPAGEWMTFSRYPIGQMNENEGPYADIWRVDTSGGREKNLTNYQDDYNGVSGAVWSPDGKHIAYNTASDIGGAVHVMRADGTHDSGGLTRGHLGFSHNATWSPDGTFLAFEWAGSEDGDVWRYSLEDGSKDSMTPTGAKSERMPIWVSCGRSSG